MFKNLSRISLFSFIFTIFSLLCVSPSFAFSGSGAGTSASPYIITTCEQLQEISNALYSYYQLGNDIDCNVAPYNTGSGFTPIINSGYGFAGNFNGENHTISNLFINDPGVANVGLFGESSGSIQNVKLSDVNITGGGNTGGLVGYNTGSSGTIADVAVVGGSITDTGSGDSVGGIVGDIYYTLSLSNSYTTVTVTGGSSFVGGLIGYGEATINNSYTSGNVIATSGGYAGGLSGAPINMNSNLVITNSFATGTITGGTDGGLVGECSPYISMTITNSYSVDSTLCGYTNGTVTINGGSAGGIALSSFYKTSPLYAVYTGSPSWDFTNTWKFNDTSSLPVFTWLATSTPTSAPAASGGGSNNQSSSAPPSCTNQPPTNSPNLFEIKNMGTSVTLYFVPVSGQNNKYVVSYGFNTNANSFTTTFDYSNTSGVIPYTVNYLFPGTWYFKIRGQNGCMPGNWSQVLPVRVGGFLSLEHTTISNNVLGAATSSTSKCQNYTVKPGDTLWSISGDILDNNYLYNSIMQQNRLKSSLITPGETIKVGC